MRDHETLSSSTFFETLLFRLPPHQSLHLCQIFNSLNMSMSKYTLIIYKCALILYTHVLYIYIYIYICMFLFKFYIRKQKPHVEDYTVLPCSALLK